MGGRKGGVDVEASDVIGGSVGVVMDGLLMILRPPHLVQRCLSTVVCSTEDDPRSPERRG